MGPSRRKCRGFCTEHLFPVEASFMTHATEIADKKKFSDHLFSFLQNKQGTITAAAVLLLFGIVVFGIYSQTFESPFIFDDLHKIKENAHIRLTQLSFEEIVKAGFKSSKTRPVAFISFALNYYFNQYDPVGYHIVNLCLHVLAGFFLFLFIKTTLKIPCLQNRFTYPALIAFWAALIWSVHPVQTQSVTYIVQRMNSMASLLFIVSFWFYVKGRLVEHGSQKWLWYTGATLAWLVSLGCKQITVTLPFMVFLYEWYFFQDLSKDWLKRSLKWALGIIVVLILIALIYTGFHPFEKFSHLNDYAQNEFTISQRALTQLRVVVYYISLLFYPNPSRLNLDYDFPLSFSLVNPLTTLPALIIIIGLLLLGIYLAKKERLLSFCIFWFLGNLVIESSFIPVAIIFEHRLYLPSMLVSLMTVTLFYLYIKPEWLSVGIICALVILCSYWTFERNKVWLDHITLWTDCTKKSPNKARPYSNLGKALTDRKMFDEALLNVKKSLEINPNFTEAHYNLGNLLEKQGKTNEAIEHYIKAVQLNPNFAKAHNNLGIALLKQDKPNEAVKHYLKALQIAPNFAKAHNNLGLALSITGEINEAIEHYTKALQINPNLAEAQFNLGSALIEQGQTEQAINRYQKALHLKPDYAEAHNNLGGQLLKQGKIDEALEHLTRALSVNPDMAEAHNNIGIIQMRKGNLEAAIFHFREALLIDPDFILADANLNRALVIHNQIEKETARIQAALKTRPDDPVAHYEMGNLFLGKGEVSRAIGQFEKALSIQPDFAPALNNLALAYTADNQHDRALETFKKLIELQPDNASTCYNIAVLYAVQNIVDEAIAWLKKAIDNGYDNWELIINDSDLKNIRNSAAYKELVKGH